MPVAIQNQGTMPVMNFNYPPAVINTLIVNGNNFVFDFNQNKIAQADTKFHKGIKEFVTSSKELLGSKTTSNKNINKNPKTKTLPVGLNKKRTKELQPARKDKLRTSYGAISETRMPPNQFKEYDSLNVKGKKSKEEVISTKIQNQLRMFPKNINPADILMSGISPSSKDPSRPKSSKDKSKNKQKKSKKTD